MFNQRESQQKYDLKCKQHPQNEATSYCSEQNCSQNGLLCNICLQSDQHSTHKPNFQYISDLNQFFKNQSLKVNLIIENFKKFSKKLQKLYLPKINNNQILLGLKNLLDFDTAQQQLRNYLEIRLPKLIEILEQTYANYNLHTIIYKISEEQNVQDFQTLVFIQLRVTTCKRLFYVMIKYQSIILIILRLNFKKVNAQYYKIKRKRHKIYLKKLQLQILIMKLHQQDQVLVKINFHVPYQLGKLYEQQIQSQGHCKKALDYYKRCLKINQHYSQALFGLGEYLRLTNQVEFALINYNKVLNIDSSNSLYHCGKGECLRLLKQITNAQISYEQALAINPKHVRTLCGKGDCLRLQDKYHDAQIWYDQALAINPQHIDSLQGKGECLYQLDKYKEAQIWYEQALAINLNHVTSLCGKAKYLLIFLDQCNASLKLLIQANILLPQNQIIQLAIKNCQE